MSNAFLMPREATKTEVPFKGAGSTWAAGQLPLLLTWYRGSTGAVSALVMAMLL